MSAPLALADGSGDPDRTRNNITELPGEGPGEIVASPGPRAPNCSGGLHVASPIPGKRSRRAIPSFQVVQVTKPVQGAQLARSHAGRCPGTAVFCVGIYQTIDDVRAAVRKFFELYNAQWLIEKKNGLRSPRQTRFAWEKAGMKHAA
jgi:hypothetical protein